MAGLDNIIDRIKGEADEVVSQVLNEANDYAKKLEDEAKNKTNEEVERLRKRCDLELKSITDRSISSSELKKKQMFLMEKQHLVMETIEKAKEKLINLPDAEYIEFVKKVFAKNAPTADCEILFNEKDKKRIGKDVIDGFVKLAKEKGANLTVSNDAAKIKSGFILNFGDIEGNCSFESLIEQNIEDLIDKVNNILFS